MCDEYLSDDDFDKTENIRVNKFFLTVVVVVVFIPS